MQVLTAPASFGHSDCERIVVGAALAQPVLAVTSLAYAVPPGTGFLPAGACLPRLATLGAGLQSVVIS